MTLLIRRSDDIEDVPSEIPWFAISSLSNAVDRPSKLSGSAQMLHNAFDAVRFEWWTLGRQLGAEASGELSHAASCASMNSDLGVMLAWDRIARDMAERKFSALMICDDPWLFRHIADLGGVECGRPPRLMWCELRLALRGMISRLYLAMKLAISTTLLRVQRKTATWNDDKRFILVYGHPTSKPSGYDAYFGPLLNEIRSLARVLHTDCSVKNARVLGKSEKTYSLHAFGSVKAAIGGIFCRWRPSSQAKTGKYGWFVRRAEAIEGAGAGAAATRWQTICQRQWLETIQPLVIAWPWESHPWERALVHDAKRLNVRTLGYQHSVVGRQMYNMTPHSDPAGEASLPDTILCTGPAYLTQLVGLGVPANILAVAGTFRITPPPSECYDKRAPIFVALAANADISRQMMSALRCLPSSAPRLLVKEHPMYPFAFDETERIQRTQKFLHEQAAVSAVLYSTGTVGLESMLAGIPTVKFLPEGLVATDIMPGSLRPLETDAYGLAAALQNLPERSGVDSKSIVTPVDFATWRRHIDFD